MEKKSKGIAKHRYKVNSLVTQAGKASIRSLFRFSPQDISAQWSTMQGQLPTELKNYLLSVLYDTHCNNPFLLHNAHSTYEVKQLIALGANVNAQKIGSLETPLHTYLWRADLSLAKTLLEEAGSSCDQSLTDYHGTTIKERAYPFKDHELRKLLQIPEENFLSKKLESLLPEEKKLSLTQEKVLMLLKNTLSAEKLDDVSIVALQEYCNELKINLKKFVNQPITHHGWTLLHCADNPTKVKILVKLGADINCKSAEEETPLHTLIKQGYNGAAQMLLHCPGLYLDACNKYKETPLCLAAQTGLLPVVKTLIQKNANVEYEDHYDNIPVNPYLYALLSHSETTGYFLNIFKAIKNVILFETLIQLTLDNNKSLFENLLKKTQYTIDTVFPCSQLTLIMQSGLMADCKLTKRLVKWGANLTQTCNGCTVLMAYMQQTRNIDQAKLFIDYLCKHLSYDSEKIKSYLELPDAQGLTALFHATHNLDIIKKLLSAGANIHALNGLGENVLMHAIRNYYGEEIIQYLLQTGANPSLTNNNGQTIYDIRTLPLYILTLIDEYRTKNH